MARSGGEEVVCVGREGGIVSLGRVVQSEGGGGPEWPPLQLLHACVLSAGAVGAPPPAGLLQPPVRSDRCEQSAEAGSSPKGGFPLQ